MIIKPPAVARFQAVKSDKPVWIHDKRLANELGIKLPHWRGCWMSKTRQFKGKVHTITTNSVLH